MAIYKLNGSISFDGEEYVSDKNGFVTVPDEAVEVLKSHGLEIYQTPVEEQKAGKTKADK